jgi:hypothetical protein
MLIIAFIYASVMVMLMIFIQNKIETEIVPLHLTIFEATGP